MNMPYVLQIPLLCITHVPPDFQVSKSGYLYAEYDRGFFIFTGEDYFEDEPQWIINLRKWARPHGFDWVRFDSDGDEVEGLEVFTWE